MALCETHNLDAAGVRDDRHRTPEGPIITAQPEQQPESLWRLPAMRVLVGYTLAGFTGFCVTISALPAWLAGRGTPAALAGLVTTVLLAATVGVQLLVPHLVQRFGLGAVLTAGLVALGAPSLLLLVDGGLGWVLAISAVRGAGFGSLTVLGSTLAARIVPVRRRGEAIGIYGLAIALPNLLAVAGGVALVAADRFAWVAILGAAPLLGLAAVPSLARHAGSDQDSVDSADPAAEAARAGTARRSRRAAGVAAIAPSVVLLVITLAGGGFTTYLPIARPDGALATVGLLVWGVTAALARWRAGMLADRVGTARLLPGSSVVTVAGMAVVVLGLLTGDGASWVLTLVGSAVLGTGYGAAQNLTLVAAFARARQRETATVSSVWNVGFDTGTALGAALVGGLTAAIDVPGALAVTAVLVAASLPLAVSSGRPVALPPPPGAAPRPAEL
jgi:MFS family permease